MVNIINALSLDAFQLLRPPIQEFYNSMSVEEKKKLEGLQHWDLANQLEIMYEKSLLESYATSLSTSIIFSGSLWSIC